ncbi:MAG: sulfatase-like hydrolase/transferase [Bryobacteraceae bacterium]
MILTRRSLLVAAAGALDRRMNVLFIAVDDLRPALGCYGDRYARTPHIDAIAAKGTVFERAYCQQAVCGPSRASLLTGLRPDTIGVYDLDTSFRVRVPDAVTLPGHFKANGYHAENIGKIFHGTDKMNDSRSWSVPERLHMVNKRDQYVLARNKDATDDWKKFDATEIADVPDTAYIDGRVADDAVSTLRRLRGRPFFLAVGFTKPHLPFAAPKKYWDMYDRREVPIYPNQTRPRNMPAHALTAYSELRSYADVPDRGPIPEDKMREVMHGYYAATSYTDANVGKVIAELDRLGLRRNTVIVLWGDHGWHLGEQDYWGKTTNFEICTRAPLILSVPGHGKGRTKALVEFVDIYPTLAEACGLPAVRGLEGVSMMPLLANPRRPWKKAVFSQYPRTQPSRVMGRSMRTDQFRYTEWGDQAVELYDHRVDPEETVNVAGEAGRKSTVDRLHAMLAAGWRAALPVMLLTLVAACARQTETARPLERLLADEASLADPAALSIVPAKTSTVFRGEEGKSGFNLHSYITHYDGKFWAVWSSGLVGEDEPGQKVRYATSVDGHIWSEPGLVADAPQKPGRWIARGIYEEGGRLKALAAYVEGTARDLPPGPLKWSALRLERFEWDGSQWRSEGLYIDNCMSNYPPRMLGGKLFMTCRDGERRTSIARAAPGGQWELERLPGSVNEKFSEPSWYLAADGTAHLIFRDAERSKYLLRSVSTDQGKTWPEPVRTNYPDATSKNFSGRLSNGWYYLINNPNQKGRDPLAISFSKDGWQFSRPMALRAKASERRYAGGAKGTRSFQYPHAMERDGSLWVIYSTNKEDIEISEYRIADFGLTPEATMLAPPGALAAPMDVPLAPGRTSLVFRGEQNKSGFNLHSYLAHHDGKFWAIWSSSKVGEEDPDQHIRYASSTDGHTWSSSGVVAADPDGPQGPARWIARGVFVFQGKLTALGAYIESAAYRNRGSGDVWQNLRLMSFEWTGAEWKPAGVFADNCMNNFAPETFGGMLMMPCRDKRMDVFLAAASAPGPGAWKFTPIASDPPFHKMDEPTLYKAADGTVHMIIRDGARSGYLIRSISRDDGKSWSKPVHTNFPDATSKNFTGRLSNGSYYLINNPSQTSRDPLGIAFSKDGWTYGNPRLLRKGSPPRRFAGRAKPSGSFQYPQALEHQGSLWVIYSTNKEDIEISEYAIGALGIPQ